MAYSDSLSVEHHKMLRDEIRHRSDSTLARRAGSSGDQHSDHCGRECGRNKLRASRRRP